MDLKKPILFSSLFILFTIIGTISHEYGHIIVAKFLGYGTELHYGSMNYDNDFKNNEIHNIINRNKTQAVNHQSFPEEQKLNIVLEEGAVSRSTNKILISSIDLSNPVNTCGGSGLSEQSQTKGFLTIFFLDLLDCDTISISSIV